MGADTFTQVGVGKTMEEAFSEARERAAWEHGHGGYTGTLAEKPGAVLFTLPPRMRVVKFLSLIESEYARYDLAEMLESAERDLAWAKGMKRGVPGRAEAIKRTQRMVARVKREHPAFWKKIPPEMHATVKRAARLYDEKWDEAVAVELRPADFVAFKWQIDDLSGIKLRGQRFFLFCGYASC